MARPQPLTVVNLVTGTELTSQYLPQRFDEAIGANWAALTPPGQGHNPLHFVATENLRVDLDLEFRAQTARELASIQRARRLLHSWHYPRNTGDELSGAGAPRLLFFWPGMLSIEAVSRSLKISHTQFGPDSDSVRFVATLSLEEMRTFRITTSEVEQDLQLRLGSHPGLENGRVDLGLASSGTLKPEDF